MKIALFALSMAGLGLTLIPALLVFAGKLAVNLHYQLMAAGALLYFATAPFWMKGKKGQ